MNDKTLDELNDMAKRWIDGEVNHLEVVSLKLFDRLLVLELANAYSMCKVGLLSEKYTAAYKLKFFQEYRELKLKTEHLLVQQEQQIDSVRNASVTLSEVCKEYGKDEVDLVKLCELQAKAIDELTHENVHIKLWNSVRAYKKPKEYARRHMNKIIDELIDRFGSKVPFEQVVMSYLNTCLKDNRREMWEQLTSDDYPTKARQQLPVKDGNAKGMLESMKKHYGVRAERKIVKENNENDFQKLEEQKRNQERVGKKGD